MTIPLLTLLHLTMRQQRFNFVHLSDSYHSLTLITITLYDSYLRWFEAYLWRSTSRGLFFSLICCKASLRHTHVQPSEMVSREAASFCLRLNKGSKGTFVYFSPGILYKQNTWCCLHKTKNKYAVRIGQKNHCITHFSLFPKTTSSSNSFFLCSSERMSSLLLYQ